MSDSAEPRGAAESQLGVVGVAVGLLAIVALAASLLRPPGAPVEGAELLARWFEVGELPGGLAVARAERLPGGEEVVVLERPDGSAAGPGAERVTLIHYPLARANRELARLFEKQEHGDGMKHAPKSELESWGQVDWDRYRARWALVRTPAGDAHVDSLRVNLSRPGFACALIATWPEGVDGALAPVADVLAALGPRE